VFEAYFQLSKVHCIDPSLARLVTLRGRTCCAGSHRHIVVVRHCLCSWGKSKVMLSGKATEDGNTSKCQYQSVTQYMLCYVISL
jgi:hypothetical protein